jgi:hypothetical protein
MNEAMRAFISRRHQGSFPSKMHAEAYFGYTATLLTATILLITTTGGISRDDCMLNIPRKVARFEFCGAILD